MIITKKTWIWVTEFCLCSQHSCRRASVSFLCDSFMLYLLILNLDVYSSKLYMVCKAPDTNSHQKLYRKVTILVPDERDCVSKQSLLTRWCFKQKQKAACIYSRHGLFVVWPPLVNQLTYDSVSRIWFIAVIEQYRECTDCMLIVAETS